jgi:hypothetical protein
MKVYNRPPVSYQRALQCILPEIDMVCKSMLLPNPQIKAVRDFRSLGGYEPDSYLTHPLIVINLDRLPFSLLKKGVDLKRILSMIVLHELGHAYLDSQGVPLPHDEKNIYHFWIKYSETNSVDLTVLKANIIVKLSS